MTLFRTSVRFILLLICFSIFSHYAYTQKKLSVPQENIIVYKNILYIGKPNLVIIEPPSDSTNKLSVTISEGTISPFDTTQGMYYVTVHKSGNTTINVFHTNNGIKTLLYSKTVQNKILPLTKEQKKIALLKIKPELSIAGYKKGRIPITAIKEVTKFEINQPYKIYSLVTYFSGPYSTDALVHSQNSDKFDDTLLQIWKRIGVGSIITIDNIKISDKSGKIYLLDGVSFFVSEN